MNDSCLSPLSNGLHFGAIHVGRVTLPQKDTSPVQAAIYRLEATRQDIDFLQKGLDTISAQTPEKSMVPKLPGVHSENHFDLAKETFEVGRGPYNLCLVLRKSLNRLI